MTKKTLKQSTALVDPAIADLAKHLDEDARESGAGGGKIFIKYSGKMQAYSVGRDNDELDPEQVFVAHPGTFTKGWACWKDRKVIDREQVLVSNRASLSKFDDLPDHSPYNEKAGDGWKEERTVQLASPESVKAGVYQFGMTNISGCFAIADLQQACVDRMKSGQSYYPCFTFGSEEFEAQGQVNGKPTMAQNIIGWLSLEAMNAIAAGEATLEDELDPVAALVKLVEPSKARKPAARKRKR